MGGANETIKFVRQKDYKFIKDIDQGGTGKTILIKDELLDTSFVCKKYEPADERDRLTYFKNFVEEIKLLHLLYHQNIVRVFNYHLYPKQVTGYIVMEFVDGNDIESYLKENPDKINSVFIQTIEGFKYLEQNKILHRDIRPKNILVTNDCIVKIIDFGFGKKIEFGNEFGKSITLNWYYTVPNEFKDRIYDFKTEVYFIAKLFESIIMENMISSFQYKGVLKEMLKSYNDRVNSFFEVSRMIIEGTTSYIDFDENEKEVYRDFAASLQTVFSVIFEDTKYATDVDKIIKALEKTYQDSVLEEYIQNVVDVTRCFVIGAYRYRNNVQFESIVLHRFLELMKGFSVEKQKIVLNHLWKRLDTIARSIPDPVDDLPF